VAVQRAKLKRGSPDIIPAKHILSVMEAREQAGKMMKGKRRFKARKTNPHFSLRCKAPDQAPQPLLVRTAIGAESDRRRPSQGSVPTSCRSIGKKSFNFFEMSAFKILRKK